MRCSFLKEYNITWGIYNVQSKENGKYLWLAVAIANYFTAVRREKVAVVELSERNALEQLARYFNKNIKDGKYFELFGVMYYPYYNEKLLPELMRKKYNHIVFDNVHLFGNRNVDMSDYQKKVTAGSFKPWEAAEYKQCLERLLCEGRIKEYRFLAEYYEHKDVKQQEKEAGISLIQIPQGLNPFRIRRTEFQFFETFL